MGKLFSTSNLLLIVSFLTLTSCASVERRTGGAEKPVESEIESELRGQIQDLRKELTASNLRVESLETRITTLNDQIKAVQVSQKHKDQSVAVIEPRAVDEVGESVSAPSMNGYVNDENIQGYRQALILYQGKKFPEAILAFSSFVERNADHPLAGNAQFYVGDSYLQQNEPKLALQEFQRVLSSYDRSPLIARTLLKMAEAEEMIQNPEAAAKYRQLLLSLFPTSPAAGDLRKSPATIKASAESIGNPVPQNVSTQNTAGTPNTIGTPITAPATLDEAAE